MSLLQIEAVSGPCWVQDAGRPGRRGEGIPAGGALVPEGRDAVNRAVGNLDGAAVLEVFGELTLRALGPVWVATAGEARGLATGERWRVSAPHPWRVRYVAVRGGFDVPVVLGGRGLLPVAGIGGGFGRPLLPGDELPVGSDVGLPPPRVRAGRDRPCRLALDAPIGVVGAPELVGPRWRVGEADRVGLRLVGPALPPRSDGLGGSHVLAPGFVELPHGGAPVVLGPDHPTTGGYPRIGRVRDLGSLLARPVGAEVRFYAGWG